MSPTISRTAVLASASVVAASALVFGAVAAASAAPQPRVAAAPDSSSSTATETATTTAASVSADITVWLEKDGFDAKIMSISDVPVDSDVELTPWSKGIEYSNPDELCGGVYVDVSLDPKSVEVWGDEEVGCDFTDITVEVVLNGAEWGTVTIASDNLFTEEGPVFEEPLPDEAAGLTSQGSFRFGRSVVTALSAPYPVLVSATASGSTFRATWSGTTAGWTLGSASFTFAAAAPGATPVLATPVFTG